MICMHLLVLHLKEHPCLLFCLERCEKITAGTVCKDILLNAVDLMLLDISFNFFFLQSKNALLSTFLFLDQIVWLHRTGIYKVHKYDPFLCFILILGLEM